MATYYTPPRQRVSSNSSAESVEEHVNEPEQISTLDIGARSYYIFPNPPTVAPPSPGPSFFSPPSSFPTSPSSSSASSLPSTRRRLRAPAHSHISGSRADTEPPLSVHAPAPDSTESDLGAEVWSWLGSSIDGVCDEDGSSWTFAPALREAGKGEWQLHLPPSLDGISHLSHGSAVAERRRARGLPRESTETMFRLSFSSRSPSRVRADVPHPRTRVPLLAFFASLLALDLDDPALRLLAYETPPGDESVLFPGQSSSSLTHHGAAEDDALADASAVHSEMHGLEKLFASSADLAGLRPLRAGLALAIPGPLGLAGLWRTVGEVCMRGGQAWKEVWSTADN